MTYTDGVTAVVDNSIGNMQVRLRDQAKASIFTHQKFISLKIVLHICFSSKGGFRQRFGTYAGLKADFLSLQKLLAYSLRIFVDNFSLLSQLQRALAAWLKIFN